MTGPAATRIRAGGAGALVLALFALGELILDKAPGVPPRTRPVTLALRAATGGFAATRIAEDAAERRTAFALGALGAVAAAFLALRLRRAAAGFTGLPDPVIALVEDAAAVSLALAVTA